MESFRGLIFNTSDPLAVPVNVKPRIYFLPSFVRLSGVALLNVALPPVMDKAKSDV